MDDKTMEPIISRMMRLNQLVLGKFKNDQLNFHAVSRDGLLDALFALFSECNTSYMKKDPHVVAFVGKYQSLINKLQSLRVSITDFEVKKVIGRGNFGEVQVVREKATGDVYAMKVLHKAETLAHQCVAFYEEERDIMAKSSSPWVTKLQYAFQDAQNLYLIMEFHAGGDMLSLLEKCHVLTEDMARFYLAELVLAIHSVHAMGYAHRDIKPDNILIDITGHIKLADFGSSSKLNSSKMVTSKMPVGTPDYIAPEVLVSINSLSTSDSGYGVECDWWSLGILAYEMLYGVTPFANEKILVVYNNIMNFEESLKFPEEAQNNSENFLSLIKGLICGANQRLGYEQLIDHSVFADIDWSNLRQSVPPHVPVVTGQDDTSNFDEFEHQPRPVIRDFASKQEFSTKNLPFVGFTYTTPFESLKERLSSLDSTFTSPNRSISESDFNSKKKEIQELQAVIANLRSSEESLKAENQKLLSSMKKKDKKIEKCDNELCRLENEITSLQSNKKELKRLLELEREDRVLTERKAAQILKCLKRKRKRNRLFPALGDSSDREEEILGPLSDQLDEALASFEEPNDIESEPFSRLMQRAKSLSPYNARGGTGKMHDDFKIQQMEAEEKIKQLEDRLEAVRYQNNKLILSAEALEVEREDLKLELDVLTKERDEALSKVSAQQKVIVKLEIDLYKLQHKEECGDESSLLELTDTISVLQKDIEEKNETISNLKTRISELKDKCTIAEQKFEYRSKQLDTMTEDNNQLRKRMVEKSQEEAGLRIQIANCKQMLTLSDQRLFTTQKELRKLKDAESCQKTIDEKPKLEQDMHDENARLYARIAELEQKIKWFEVSKSLKKKDDEFCSAKSSVKSISVIDSEDTDGNMDSEDVDDTYVTCDFVDDRTISSDDFDHKNIDDKDISRKSSDSTNIERKRSVLRRLSREMMNVSIQVDDDQANSKDNRDENRMEFLIQENERLVSKIKEVEEKLAEASNKRNDETKLHFIKELNEKDDMLTDTKRELRIALRDKKKSDDLLSILRESNRSLKEDLAKAQAKLIEKEKLEMELKDKVEILEKEVSWKEHDISEKIKKYEIEKARLEERIKGMQEVHQTQKGINDIFVKTQGQFQEISKQNEKLKTDYTMNEMEKSQMYSELETVKNELQCSKKECDKLKKIIVTLKSACSDLETQLQDFESLVKSREDEVRYASDELSKRKQYIISLEADLKAARADYTEEKQLRIELEKQIEEMEEDLESQHAIHETEVQSLEEVVEQQKSIIRDLEEQITEMEKQYSKFNQDINVYEHKTIKLEEELVRLKEEAAKYITQVTSLKASNLKLTQDLDYTFKKLRTVERVVDDLNNELESADANFSHEKVKLQETIIQQTKLIDFLQTKTETMEKRKKTLNLPRLFGKKDNTANIASAYTGGTEELEREKTRCRRLQDQLSQARAENMALRSQLSNSVPKTPISERSKSSIPVSPMSRAMHLALTASPTTNSEVDSPLLITRETSKKIVKLQGMTHRIPHRFTEILCMRGSKCVACLDSIHFGRRAVKCQECSAICHSKCAWSLPKTCGLPSGFIQHFESAVNKNPSVQITSDATASTPEGWVKVPKPNKQGWERRYLRIVDSVLYFFEESDDDNINSAVDRIDFSDAHGETVVISAVSAAELTHAAKSDLPFVLKVDYRPFTTCWPSRCLYIMATSFNDKQMWVSTLESLAEKYKAEQAETIENKLSGHPILKLKGDKCVDILCTFILKDDILLLGAMEGLFVVSLNEQTMGTLKYKIEGIDSVYQMTRLHNIGIMVLISGDQRSLGIIKLEALTSWINGGTLTPIEMDLITDAKGCHLFAVEEEQCGSMPYLCSATADTVTLYRWDNMVNMFCQKKVSKTQEPCSCIHFTKSSVILGCDKFFEMDLKTYDVQEFLDRTDASLACLVYGVPQFQSFPISIFLIASDDQTEEYLVCFHELGVFVDGFGQRTRPDDMKWSRLPLAFAYRAPYLFMTHFNSVEVIELLPRGTEETGVRGVMKVPNPQYLGPAPSSDAVYISTCQDQTVEILCIEGETVKSRDVTSDTDETGSECRVPSQTSKDSEGDALDFSFSNSLLQSLDSPSGDQLSLSSTSDTTSNIS